jgi:hypothetical protein
VPLVVVLPSGEEFGRDYCLIFVVICRVFVTDLTAFFKFNNCFVFAIERVRATEPIAIEIISVINRFRRCDVIMGFGLVVLRVRVGM